MTAVTAWSNTASWNATQYATAQEWVAGADNSVTSVEGLDADSTCEPVYYNLQGIRIAKPESGVYIEVRGTRVTKHIVR